MKKVAITFFLLCLTCISTIAQTTDLSVTVLAENLSGTPISQVDVYEEFQYIITIINSGDAVNNATFSQDLSPNLFYQNGISQNEIGGASGVTNLSFGANTVTGTIANMPSSSSVEVKVLVRASITPGGIATNVEVFPPVAVTDINEANNTAIISIDVNSVFINFSVTQAQIVPASGTGISSWTDTVTYEFTITNNTSIAFPLSNFSGLVQLESNIIYGSPIVELVDLVCIGGTNGMTCPTDLNIPSGPVGITSMHNVFGSSSLLEFSAGGSLTFQFTYEFFEPSCVQQLAPMEISSTIEIGYNGNNGFETIHSNAVTTPLLESSLCPLTDVCIETIQINPDVSQMINWNEEVTFVTTVCNNGPLEAVMRFFLQNLSISIDWNIISVTCNGTTGAVTCNDFVITDEGVFWSSDSFLLPANTTIEVTTVVVFLEPDGCEVGTPTNSLGHVRSGTNILTPGLVDFNLGNNAESDYVMLPPLDECEPEEIVDFSITKTQINPVFPEGSNAFNTTDWGEITYEIVATNPGILDAEVVIRDFMPSGINSEGFGTLVSVDCVAFTGTATCQNISVANIGVAMDGELNNGEEDIFWEILPDDHWLLPAESSVTFHVVISWEPECSESAIVVANEVSMVNTSDILDNNPGNDSDVAVTYFASCVDLLVQTYPELTPVGVNENFNWVVDITNSNTSSNAININVEDVLDPQFTIVGPPSCMVISGTATCPVFNINGNVITGVIASMAENSTIQILIPVTAPSYGGAYTNTVQALPNADDNEEQTPETNVSISNVQVIAPEVIKSFVPSQIIVGEQSVLEFTVYNLIGSPAQSGISFIDNLPTGLTLAGPVTWVQDNGCTANFSGTLGGISVGVNNLTFPAGVASCSFSVAVIGTTVGGFTNDSLNFTDINNIDPSLASATLTVLADTSNVDIEVLKIVNPSEVAIGSEVVFTITATNVGTTTGTNITVFESLPIGYLYTSSVVSSGSYNESSYFWDVNMLLPGQSETLSITAQVIATQNLLNTASLESLSEIDRDDSNNEDSAAVVVNNCLQIANGFSPNDDGDNDFFVIPCIEDYSKNSIEIYSRYGNLVFKTNNYTNSWDGVPNQGVNKNKSVLPRGTYYYVLNIETIASPLVGWVYLNY